MWLGSCTPETDIQSGVPPEGLIDQQTMVDILIDIHLAEARANQLNIPPDSAAWYYRYQQEQILQDYGLDSARFRESYNYYLQNVPLIDEIYGALVDSLSAREARNQAVQRVPSLDSIRNAK
ncbi:protein of unknown function [Catalinimonas alkaloidigena]|uniref:DUF4296 domain-containing protein n=2 Tax=Catalinimonas alkaloidigena TaxID=1075417 RepID=A0A1G9GZ86_9BACT|nr:protein of unknown function [Catalinimonas alkaloidigena]